MAVYERFQVLSAGRQNLFQPQSPVWVSRVQLSLDRDSGKRLLQARMVNLSEKTIRQIFLRIRCLDGARRQLAQLEMVPLGALRVLPGRVFGDDKPLELTPKEPEPPVEPMVSPKGITGGVDISEIESALEAEVEKAPKERLPKRDIPEKAEDIPEEPEPETDTDTDGYGDEPDTETKTETEPAETTEAAPKATRKKGGSKKL